MRNLLIILTLLLSTTLFAQNGEKNFIDQNYIEVVGSSDMEVTPDRIYIRILINEKDIKGKSLIEVEQSMVDKLKELGIDVSKDLTIKDLISNFQFYWFIKSDVLLSKEYQLVTHDAKTTGKVFIELQKLGISNVSVERVENSKINEYRKEVKIAAIKSAQDKARSIAQAINQDIGRAMYIQEIENSKNSITGALAGNASGVKIRGTTSLYGLNTPEPDLEFEKIKLEYYISVRFELK